MKVKALVNYDDMKLKRLVTAGEEFEVTDNRGLELVKAKVCEAVKGANSKEKPAEKATSKKKGAK